MITPISNLSSNLTFQQNNVKEILSNKSKDKSLILQGGCGVLSAAALTTGLIIAHQGNYITQLAKDLSKELHQKITPQNLRSIMTKSEMLRELPKLREENYIATYENIRNGTFIADLHSHSNFSDGSISVEELLNQASKYGDKLNKINGKKFIFALTDHDGIDGVKEALKIIAKNPEKYKNVKFLPASEVSFIYPCDKNSSRFKRFGSDVQMPEMLVYNINPFSAETGKFFSNIYKKRDSQVSDIIDYLNREYNSNIFKREEYVKYFNLPDKKPCFLNQHWNLWNYLHIKNRIAKIAEEQGKNSDALFKEILEQCPQNGKNPYFLSRYLESNNIKTKTVEIDMELAKKIKQTIFPKNLGNQVESKYEITLDDIFNYAKKEGAVLGFAHPGFTMQNMSKEACLSEMQALIKKSNGLIKFIEKYHQAYPVGVEISREELNFYNGIIDKLKLVKIGGRDNHSKSFIP